MESIPVHGLRAVQPACGAYRGFDGTGHNGELVSACKFYLIDL